MIWEEGEEKWLAGFMQKGGEPLMIRDAELSLAVTTALHLNSPPKNTS